MARARTFHSLKEIYEDHAVQAGKRKVFYYGSDFYRFIVSEPGLIVYGSHISKTTISIFLVEAQVVMEHSYSPTSLFWSAMPEHLLEKKAREESIPEVLAGIHSESPYVNYRTEDIPVLHYLIKKQDPDMMKILDVIKTMAELEAISKDYWDALDFEEEEHDG